jgi:S1-C subfamily serine protease
MRAVLSVLTAMIVITATVDATDWRGLVKTVNPSIVFVESDGGKCTGFVINAAWKDDTDLIATARHCEGKELFADHRPAKVIYKHTKDDLMVVSVEDTGRPALAIAKGNPETGEEVASYGYGYALERPMFRTAHVADDKAKIPDWEGGPFVMIDAAYVEGQSGGPCVNLAGEVVSIVQAGTNKIGFGIGAEQLRDALSRYVAKPKP